MLVFSHDEAHLCNALADDILQRQSISQQAGTLVPVQNFYIAFTLDESVIHNVLYFPMKNIYQS